MKIKNPLQTIIKYVLSFATGLVWISDSYSQTNDKITPFAPLPPAPSPVLTKNSSESPPVIAEEHKSQPIEKKQVIEKKNPESGIEHGKELVTIDFPNGVNLSDIIKTIGVWSGKNFILGQGVSGNSKISIVAPEAMTKEEAYQVFLSALNISGFTTVETGKIVKILPIATARSANIKTYYGQNWAPATDEIINQVIPLNFIEANTVINQLRPLLGMTLAVPFTTTNTVVLTDTGFRIRRILEVIKLLDDKSNQAQVSIVPINYMDAKDANQKIQDIFGSKAGTPSLALQKSLVDEKSNSLILVGPARGLDDVVRFLQRIDKPNSTNQGSQSLIRVRPLDYADAEKLAQTLNALASNRANSTPRPSYLPPNFTPGVLPMPGASTGATNTVADLSGLKITSDKETNSLIIQGTKTAYEEIENLIQVLDKRRAQVYLEASLLDLNVGDGLDWKPSVFGGTTSGDRYMIPFGFNPGSAASLGISKTGTQDFSSTLTSLGSNAILGILSNKKVNIAGIDIRPGALLFALKTSSTTNVIQTPSMLVSDNETAKFTSSEQYKTVVFQNTPGTGGPVGSPQQYDVTTGLTVLPHISRSDYVNMKINLQIDDAGQKNKDDIPTPITKRSAESVINVPSGQTIVLGGITKDSQKKSEAKVPLLGEIPIIGWFFKQVSYTKIKSNLSLFLTPYIVRNSEDLAKIYEQKVSDRDEFLKMYYGLKHKEEDDFYKQLPTREQGQAAPAMRSENSSSKSEEMTSLARDQTLPSKEAEPITAPAQSSGSGFYNGNVGVQGGPIPYSSSGSLSAAPPPPLPSSSANSMSTNPGGFTE